MSISFRCQPKNINVCIRFILGLIKQKARCNYYQLLHMFTVLKRETLQNPHVLMEIDLGIKVKQMFEIMFVVDYINMYMK